MNVRSPHRFVLVVAALGLLLGGCGHAPDDSTSKTGANPTIEGKLVLTGSSTVAPLAAEIAKRYEAAHPGVRIDVQSGGSSRGVADVRSGVADIGMVSRALKPEESDLRAYTIARDGIAMIVHARNEVAALSDDQVRAIYRGEIDNWKVLGGDDRAITVVNKAEGRSTLELFLHYFQLEPAEIRSSVVIGDNEQGVKTVAGNPGAIGYVSIGTAEYAQTHAVPIRLLPLNGVAASVDAVRQQRFPLSRPLNLVTKTDPVGLARDFIDYARSPAVHDVVEGLYFVPLD